MYQINNKYKNKIQIPKPNKNFYLCYTSEDLEPLMKKSKVVFDDHVT